MSTPFDPDAEYTLRAGPFVDVRREEIDLLKRISDAIDEHVGFDSSPPERRAAVEEIAEEDGEFLDMLERLQKLSRSNPSSVLDGLIELVEEEAGGEAEPEDEAEPDENPLAPAERALEEHEGELLERLMARTQEGIPEDATVAEAIASMLHQCRNDPEAKELIDRLATIMYYGGGTKVWQLPSARKEPPELT